MGSHLGGALKGRTASAARSRNVRRPRTEVVADETDHIYVLRAGRNVGVHTRPVDRGTNRQGTLSRTAIDASSHHGHPVSGRWQSHDIARGVEWARLLGSL